MLGRRGCGERKRRGDRGGEEGGKRDEQKEGGRRRGDKNLRRLKYLHHRYTQLL